MFLLVLSHSISFIGHIIRRGDFVVQIPPCGIRLGDQPRFSNPPPMLDILLTLDRGVNRVMHFEIDQTIDGIALRETLDQAMFVLVTAAYKIIRDADIERPTRTACENV